MLFSMKNGKLSNSVIGGQGVDQLELPIDINQVKIR